MNETSKSKRYWGELEWSILQGEGIDIGCGSDPVSPNAYAFDRAQGDANCIADFVKSKFDFVFSSHCLEHMNEPREALQQWWSLVKPGGHLFFIVPDEDLYEQGVFPSRFNADHKATFTISKAKSWSSVSINVLDLVSLLPGGELVSLRLDSQGYDYSLLKHGTFRTPLWILAVDAILKRTKLRGVRRRFQDFRPIKCRSVVDQTSVGDALAQITCIVKKRATS